MRVYKLSLISLISFLNFFYAQSLLAQYPGMRAIRASYNNLLFNQQMRMQVFGRMNVEGSDQEYLFQVMMRDSTKKEIISAIYTDKKNKQKFLILVDKSYKKSDSNRYKKIYPSQTIYIADPIELTGNEDIENAPRKYLYGKPADTCWMFNIKAGAINVYSNSCEGWDNKYSPATVVGIQLNDESVVEFNAENLKKMIEQDAEAMKDFDKKKYFKAIEIFNRNVEKAAKK